MNDGKDTIGAKALEVVTESMKRREGNPMSEPDTSAAEKIRNRRINKLSLDIWDLVQCTDREQTSKSNRIWDLLDRFDKEVSASENAGLQARVDELEGVMKDADNCVTFEINPSNYGHDEVCLLNDQITEAILCLRAALKGDTE